MIDVFTPNFDIFMSLSSFIFTLVALSWEHFKVIGGMSNRITKLETKVAVLPPEYVKCLPQELAGIHDSISRMETKIDVFWKSIENMIVKQLHHPLPQFAKRDKLLDKFKDKTITIGELNQLKGMLSCTPIKKGDPEALAAVLLIARIDTILFDVTHNIVV